MNNLLYFKVEDKATVRNCEVIIYSCEAYIGPPLWSLPTDPEVRVRFPALPDFLRSSCSGMGSTQPRGELFQENSGSGLENRN
jgi:hypothetical protein